MTSLKKLEELERQALAKKTGTSIPSEKFQLIDLANHRGQY